MRMKKKEAKREEEKGRKKRAKPGHFKRRCEGFVSVEASEIFRQVGHLESCGGLSWGDPLEMLDDLSECELFFLCAGA